VTLRHTHMEVRLSLSSRKQPQEQEQEVNYGNRINPLIPTANYEFGGRGFMKPTQTVSIMNPALGTKIDLAFRTSEVGVVSCAT